MLAKLGAAQQWQTRASIKVNGGTGAESQAHPHRSTDNDGRKSGQNATPPKLKLKMQVNQSRKDVKRQEKPKVMNLLAGYFNRVCSCLETCVRILYPQSTKLHWQQGCAALQLVLLVSSRTCGKAVVTYSWQLLATCGSGQCEQLGNRQKPFQSPLLCPVTSLLQAPLRCFPSQGTTVQQVSTSSTSEGDLDLSRSWQQITAPCFAAITILSVSRGLAT